MQTTYGIVCLNPSNQILVGHVTRQPYDCWTIIKGLPEKNEKPLDVIKREFFEETSMFLHLICKEIIDVSKTLDKIYNYTKSQKQLYGFVGILHDNIDIAYFKCHSMVKDYSPLPDFPELDSFVWLDYQDIDILHYTQQDLIKDIFNNILKKE